MTDAVGIALARPLEWRAPLAYGQTLVGCAGSFGRSESRLARVARASGSTSVSEPFAANENAWLPLKGTVMTVLPWRG